MNFLSQVRALPNPSAGSTHPLTLHLTPTSAANILVTSLTPVPKGSQAFVKISPDAEVIVAPKTRQQGTRPGSSGGVRDSRSVASRRSDGALSHKSNTRHRSGQDDEKVRPPIFLRAVTRALRNHFFEGDEEVTRDEGLKIWVDREDMLSKTLKGVNWVIVSIVRPAGLQEPIESPQQQPEHETVPAAKVVARLGLWDDAPDAKHAALSSLLCGVLGVDGVVGSIVRIDPANPPLPKTASALKEPSQQASKDAIIKRLRITPFVATSRPKDQAPGFHFGGESKHEREEATNLIKSLFEKTLFDGPLTDGMLVPAKEVWPGGILDLEPSPPGDPSAARVNWLLGSERKLDIVVQPETTPPRVRKPPGEPLPEKAPSMVGIEQLIEKTKNTLLHSSSVLLTGGIGSGKTSMAQLLAHQLRSEYLFHTIYFPCRMLITDEMRVKTIKENIHRVFASAQWGARLGSRALVVLDDLDRLCPVETELQVDANGRSKQVSELLCTIVREFCGRDSGVVLLATAQSKEAVNNVIVGSHVVSDILSLKAPDKVGRKKILEMLVAGIAARPASQRIVDSNPSDGSAWMDGSDESRPSSANGPLDGVQIDSDLDLLEIAGQTDGYMPGDINLLISRARSEALIRAASDASSFSDKITLGAEDFAAALKGFTPASLRGVTLQSSTTAFASIGGLKQTRRTLLETLQYPTTYAPLFAKCPLRLRSGLLLYGYPGCGKTLLASAVAGECGLNFISVNGPEILNKYIGASEKSVRDLFERAEAAKPCVLFFDEFDSIAPKRGHDSTGVTDRVVNMLLTMMDGAEGLSGVYVLAATSRPDLIDPALLRPGRLDKSLICDMPDTEDRMDILTAISKKLHIDPALISGDGPRTLREVAERTEGYSGADLQAVMYNAHLDAIHDMLGNTNDATAKEVGMRKSNNSAKSGSKYHDFDYFRYGGNGRQADKSPALSAAAIAAERAEIVAKLAALQLAKHKARQERHDSQQSRPSSSNGQSNGTAIHKNHHADPIVTWHHVEKSVRNTRASISTQERRRLAAIYREFKEGRNGEMSDGQGGTEIGGRTSLI